MSPFWGSFSEQFRGCGRDATLFLVGLVALILGLVAVAIANSLNLFEYARPILIGVLMAFTGRVGFLCYQARRRPTERFHRRPLSRDEVRVARSKLLKNRASNY
jgi:hypothetical protein